MNEEVQAKIIIGRQSEKGRWKRFHRPWKNFLLSNQTSSVTVAAVALVLDLVTMIEVTACGSDASAN